MYCKQNRIVSTNRYSAMRVTGIEKVTGYLVKDKKDGTIIGILNEDAYYAELAYVDENTLEPVVEESCVGLCEIYKKQLQYVREIVEDVIKNCASKAVMQQWCRKNGFKPNDYALAITDEKGREVIVGDYDLALKEFI